MHLRIDPALWKLVEAERLRQGVTQREVVEEALRRHLGSPGADR